MRRGEDAQTSPLRLSASRIESAIHGAQPLDLAFRLFL
jgi:hypothetical protein